MYCLFLQGYDSLDHTNTKHQPETMELLQEWRALLDGSSNKPGREKLVDLSHLLYLIDTFKSVFNLTSKVDRKWGCCT
jgi:hypothetical protein